MAQRAHRVDGCDPAASAFQRRQYVRSVTATQMKNHAALQINRRLAEGVCCRFYLFIAGADQPETRELEILQSRHSITGSQPADGILRAFPAAVQNAANTHTGGLPPKPCQGARCAAAANDIDAVSRARVPAARPQPMILMLSMPLVAECVFESVATVTFNRKIDVGN